MKPNGEKRKKIFAFHVPYRSMPIRPTTVSTMKQGIVVSNRSFFFHFHSRSAFEEMQSKKIYLCLERERSSGSSIQLAR